MKTSCSCFLLCAFLVAVSPAGAQMYQSVPADQAELIQSGPGQLYCPNCGMNLVKFYKTSHALGQHQYCSLHCLAEANAGTDGARVVDCVSLKFIPVAEAHYVVGSGIKGTMTMTSKYAFAERAQAESFARENGGELMSFAEAEALARKSLDKENRMIAKKRQAMAEKGGRIFLAMCSDTDLPIFSSIAEAKTYLLESGLCDELDDDQYQAVAVYLVSKENREANASPILVPEKAKCPVCGMFVAKYPNWVAEIRTTDDRQYFFDGVKDMMKFLFDPERYQVKMASEQIAAIRVSDYYNLGPMDAREAWYVVGSNVYGPMGDELIPFRTRNEAEVFRKDHFGKSIVTFDKISADLVQGLDH
jgi:nitrous oxide reductase accessory protein NosL